MKRGNKTHDTGEDGEQWGQHGKGPSGGLFKINRQSA